jgi:lysophospholipase L1-like esterase
MLKPWIIALAFGGLAATAQARPADQPPRPSVTKFVLVGDSTTAAHGGWGPAFCGERLAGATACINLARAGRSSSSYRAEGSWTLALDEMRAQGFAATYVLIQFGHNDQPGKPGRSTDLATEFPANLKRYVEEARAAGAKPVLVTPLTRRGFRDGKLADTLGPWAQAVREVAAATQTPVVDLHAMSMEAVQALGPAEAARFAKAPPPAAAALGQAQDNLKVEPAGAAKAGFDNTHLGPVGATFFSGQVARGLAKAVPEIAGLLAD